MAISSTQGNRPRPQELGNNSSFVSTEIARSQTAKPSEAATKTTGAPRLCQDDGRLAALLQDGFTQSSGAQSSKKSEDAPSSKQDFLGQIPKVIGTLAAGLQDLAQKLEALTGAKLGQNGATPGILGENKGTGAGQGGASASMLGEARGAELGQNLAPQKKLVSEVSVEAPSENHKAGVVGLMVDPQSKFSAILCDDGTLNLTVADAKGHEQQRLLLMPNKETGGYDVYLNKGPISDDRPENWQHMGSTPGPNLPTIAMMGPDNQLIAPKGLDDKPLTMERQSETQGSPQQAPANGSLGIPLLVPHPTLKKDEIGFGSENYDPGLFQ